MKSWPRVKLGDVLRRSEEIAAPISDHRYHELTVRLWGKGVISRGIVSGVELSTARRFVARAGQLVLSRIDARNGASGIVPPELDGAIVSTDFPLFNLNAERVDLAFLGWLIKTAGFIDACMAASEGTTNRVRLQETKFYSLEIPLPPLAEQRRVVARIEELSAKISEAASLRQQIADEASALCRSIITHDREAKPTRLRELVRLRPPDVTVQKDETYQFAGVYCFGRGVFKSVRKSGTEFAYPRLTRLRSRDFVYPKLMAWEGAFGVVPPECDGCVVSTEFPVFEINEDRVLPEVLDTYFRMPSVWPKIAGVSTGTNVRRRRLNPGDFLDYEMPLPSRAAQTTLRDVMAKLAVTLPLHADTAAELDALLPAILDRAFKGEL